MKKKNILIVHNYYRIPGGEDTVVKNEKDMLEENGHKVVLYTRNNDEIKNLGKIKLLFESFFSFKTYNEVKRIVKENNIDVVHVHNTLPLVSPSIYYAAKKCKVKVIQTVHNFRLMCPSGTFTRKNSICEDCVQQNLFAAIRHKCYRNSKIQTSIVALTLLLHRILGTYKIIDKYIVLTEFNKNKLKVILDEKKIVIKPNFVKRSMNLELNNEKKHFLFLGRIEELKGIRLLVKTCEKMKNIEIVIAGTGPLEEEIKQYIKKNKIKNINLVGYKSKEEVFNLLKTAKALIVPSQCYEGFPMTIVESLSLGVPVITGNIGNLSTIIKHNYNGLIFNYNNEKSLMIAIDKLNKDVVLRKKLSLGANETYNQKYNEIENYRILEQIYD